MGISEGYFTAGKTVISKRTVTRAGSSFLKEATQLREVENRMTPMSSSDGLHATRRNELTTERGAEADWRYTAIQAVISSKPLRNRDSWGNVMVASRNQQHVMSRASGRHTTAQLPAYGADGEMSTYLNGRRQKIMRGLGAGPKPKMQPVTKGEVMESIEISI